MYWRPSLDRARLMACAHTASTVQSRAPPRSCPSDGRRSFFGTCCSGRRRSARSPDGAPGISRTLLAYRLKELEHAGVITSTGRARGHGRAYALTKAGSDLNGVMLAMGTWGERWLELGPPHLDPGVVLDSWIRWYLARENLPDRRVVVRFDLPDRPRKADQLWIIFDGEQSEVCRTNPGLRRGPGRPGVIERTRRVASRADRMGRRAPLGRHRRGRSTSAGARAPHVESPERLGAPRHRS